MQRDRDGRPTRADEAGVAPFGADYPVTEALERADALAAEMRGSGTPRPPR